MGDFLQSVAVSTDHLQVIYIYIYIYIYINYLEEITLYIFLVIKDIRITRRRSHWTETCCQRSAIY